MPFEEKWAKEECATGALKSTTPVDPSSRYDAVEASSYGQSDLSLLSSDLGEQLKSFSPIEPDTATMAKQHPICWVNVRINQPRWVDTILDRIVKDAEDARFLSFDSCTACQRLGEQNLTAGAERPHANCVKSLVLLEGTWGGEMWMCHPLGR